MIQTMTTPEPDLPRTDPMWFMLAVFEAKHADLCSTARYGYVEGFVRALELVGLDGAGGIVVGGVALHPQEPQEAANERN